MAQKRKKPELKKLFVILSSFNVSAKQITSRYVKTTLAGSDFWNRKRRSTAQLKCGDATVSRRFQGLHWTDGAVGM